MELRDNIKALGLSPNHIFQQVKDAVAEDLMGGEDITSVATISESQVSTADFVARKAGIISGLHVAAAVLEYCGINHYEVLVDEGAKVEAGKVLITAQGNTRKLLLAERTALNFLTHLSGISTTTNKWVQAVAGTKCLVRDSRKTLSAEGLIKDNHILASGGITSAFKSLKDKFPGKAIEIEVDSLDQLTEAVKAGAQLVLLDNMTPEQCKAAVSQVSGKCKLEASGGITLENAKAYADSGVDFIAIGALTHSAPALDIGLDFRKGK